jgi:LmbE family N-acetylglucosaminyl deacetylase
MTRTLVTFHAHPDDEAIATAGVMAQAAANGHRVVLVLATRGELGEIVPGVLDDGETLAERRVVEVERAAKILGASRVAFLDYHDSGMAGEPTNDAPTAFAAADVDAAAERLAAILREEQAEVLTVYDEDGVYGHPDHVQVHRVGMRAAELAGTPRVYQQTVDRDHLKALISEGRAGLPDDVEVPDPDEMDLGVSADKITTRIDVREYVDVKREAMRAHQSQIAPDSFFLQLPDEQFRESFGYEWFIRADAPRPGVETSLWD